MRVLQTFIILFFILIWFSYSIKLYNDTNSLFSWKLILSGASSSNKNFNISINPWKEVIVWDANNILSWISMSKTWLSLSISDKKAIDIQLLSSTWYLLDSLFVSTWNVSKYNDKKTSFEKIFSWWIWTINTTNIVKNAQTWYVANPWYVEIKKETFNNIVQTCSINLANKTNNTFNFSYTWNFDISNVSWFVNGQVRQNGQNMSITLNTGWNYNIQAVWQDLSWNVCTWTYGIYFDKWFDNTNFFNWSLKISEIHPWKDSFDEYVEIQAVGNVSGDFVLNGFGRWSKTLQLKTTLYSW